MKSAALLAAAGLLLFGVSCSSATESEPDRIATPADAQAAIEGAALALANAESYRTTIAFPLPAEDARGAGVWDVFYQRPDSYRLLLFSEDGPSTEVCETHALPGGSGGSCRNIVTEVTERSVFEMIFVGDATFSRGCDGVDRGCEDWQKSPETDLPIFGLSPSSTPGWPAIVLEVIAVDAGMQMEAGDELVRVSGSVNLVRAILENQRRLSEAAGITTFGGSCTVVMTPGDESGEEECIETENTFEDLLEQEDDVAFEDENPSQVAVWVSLVDGLPRRIEITQAPRPGDANEGAIVIEFGDYGEVTIEAPE